MAPALILFGFLTLRVKRNKGLVYLVGTSLTRGKGSERLSIVVYGLIYKPKDGKKEKIFDVLEWPCQKAAGCSANGMMCSHVPNKGERMVRYYGHYSNVARGKRKKQRSNRFTHIHSFTSQAFHLGHVRYTYNIRRRLIY